MLVDIESQVGWENRPRFDKQNRIQKMKKIDSVKIIQIDSKKHWMIFSADGI